MERTNDPVQLEALLSSLETIENQRPILGDAIEPLLAGINKKIASYSPAEPSEEQLKVIESWQTVLKTSEDLGLAAPEPSTLIIEATSAKEKFEEFQQKVGKIGLKNNVEAVPEKVVGAKTVPVKKTKANKPAKPKTPQPQAKRDKITTVEINSPTEVILSDGKNEYKLAESVAPMYVKVLKALAETPDNTINTTEFIRELVGTTSSELQRARRGSGTLPEGIDGVKAEKVTKQFYSVVKRLKERQLIHHDRGHAFIAPGENRNKPGFIKLVGPISFTDDDGVMRINATAKPYALAVNLYDHTIDNGRDKKVEVGKDDESFFKISQALGCIALQPNEKHEKITRSDIVNWMSESPEVEEQTAEQATRISHDISELIAAFKEDFPLHRHGKRGGAYFSWDSSTTLETIEGWPEKPRFDEPVHINIGLNGISASSEENSEVQIVQYGNTFKHLLDARDLSSERLIANGKSYFELLSLLGEQDKLKLDDAISMIYGEDIQPEEKSKNANRFRDLARRLNSAFGEDIINWQNHLGVVIDVNRKIIVVDETSGIPTNDTPDEHTPKPTDSPADLSDPEGVTDTNIKTDFDHENDTTTPDMPSPFSNETPVDLDKIPVEHRKSADELVLAALNLDEHTKKTISGRLTQHGRFEYPEKIEEAVYLLQLASNTKVLAELRETDRFRDRSRKTEDSAYKDFMAELVFACYIRTLSWGDFDEITDAIKRTTASSHNIDAAGWVAQLGSESRNTVSTVSTDINTRQSRNGDSIVLEKALEGFIKGSVIAPENPFQAIAMLDVFRKNRKLIASDKTNEQFQSLLSDLHKLVGDVLGKDNMRTALDYRTPQRSSTTGRAVQTASGEQHIMLRTDSHRYPSGRDKRHRRSKR